MSGKSKIQWTDASWNPVVGCTKISPGCLNCYAEKMAYRLACMGKMDYNITVLQNSPTWTGKTRHIESALTKPLHWKTARKIFVCSMGDLFHESVPFEFIDKVFAIMALCSQHTFQVLTKRHERRKEYLSLYRAGSLYDAAHDVIKNHADYKELMDGLALYLSEKLMLPNVWQGSTICNQEEADKHIPTLLQTPAAVRFVSVEPMLGPLNFGNICSTRKGDSDAGWGGKKGGYPYINCLTGREYSVLVGNDTTHKLDWVIIGCESGKGRRRCDPQHIIDLVEQCKAAGVPYFVKQMDINGKVSKEPSEWPEVCREQVYPK